MNFFQFHQVIDVKATGENIRMLRQARDLTVREVQEFMSLASPQAIYHWEAGTTLPSVDNLYMLAGLFRVKIDDILVPKSSKGNGVPSGGGTSMFPRFSYRFCMRGV